MTNVFLIVFSLLLEGADRFQYSFFFFLAMRDRVPLLAGEIAVFSPWLQPLKGSVRPLPVSVPGLFPSLWQILTYLDLFSCAPPLIFFSPPSFFFE